MHHITKVTNVVIVSENGDRLVDIDEFFKFTFANLYVESQSLYYLDSLYGFRSAFSDDQRPINLIKIEVDGAVFLPCRVGLIRKKVMIIKSKLRKLFLPKDYGRMYNLIESITRNRQNGFVIVRYCQNTGTGVKEPSNFSLSVIKKKGIIIPQFDFTHLSGAKKRNLLFTGPTVNIFVDYSKKTITTQTANCSYGDKFAHKITSLIPSLNEQIFVKDDECRIHLDADRSFTDAVASVMESEIF